MTQYNHLKIEAKWQHYWEKNHTFATGDDLTQPKFYVLDMFPYPSGNGLHVGHPKGYVATDVVARAKRMMGFNVLHPMGWDSFGLPSERQAIREGISPQEVTARNIQTFRKQLKQLGLSYDWKRELATSEASYYKWTQWIFLQLYKRGLAYQSEIAVNWCPAQGTVLANEEVQDGCYVETGDPVEKRLMRQWMLKITDYAESLLAGLDELDWPEGVKEMQRNWIGRSEGATVTFSVAERATEISVFTTRPDTLFGCAALVLAPEHPLAAELATEEQRGVVEAYQIKTSKRSERDRTTAATDAEKTGVFIGAYAINPINDQKIPIWIADYVLLGYGTGAIFSCPAHDERDYSFAQKFGLAIVTVVKGGDGEQAYTGDGEHLNSGFLNGMKTAEAKAQAIDWLENQQKGNRQINYRLRDWLFSRQRYWGEPIPVLHTPAGVALVPENDLPVTLPQLDQYQPTEDGNPPLSRNQAWVQSKTSDHQDALRETNTMPQWAGSCWYYLRFINPDSADCAWQPEDEAYWMPVDLYVGGAEHATLHLLYARFWHHVLYDLNLVSTKEPFARLFNQGMVYGDSYQDAKGKYYYRDEVSRNPQGDWQTIAEGALISTRKEKMSKSRYNVVNPEDMCHKYGADALRLYELFMGALEDNCEWETSGVSGCKRFLDRAFRLICDNQALTREAITDKAVEQALHQSIKAVTEAVDSLRFNTAIAKMMAFVNVATKATQLKVQWLKDFICILSPFAPHIAAELWEQLGHQEGLEKHPFPKFDHRKIQSEVITLAIQINGKLKGTIDMPADASEAEVITKALSSKKIAKSLEGKTLKRKIYVPKRVVNLVVG